jgi:hypothetical protein
VQRNSPYRGLPQKDRPRTLGRGMTQLSLVEHALCPINAAVSLRPNLTHEAAYFFTDKSGVRRKAQARVLCPEGLSAHDELYLWGLLALTFSQTEPSTEFTATPHYCLRQLGLIEDKQHRGGKTYRLFRQAIQRLAAVTYQNNNFYDPVRAEHCQISFGFFDYRLPLDTDSARAWRFYWSPVFFEICQAAGSALAFDLDTFRQLDVASRRLYLLLKKMFWRRRTALRFDVRNLAVDVLGFSAARPAWELKQDLRLCVEKLAELGILALPASGSAKDLFYKVHKGQFMVSLTRGALFDRQSSPTRDVLASPHYELLQAIGLEPTVIARILCTYPIRLVGEWADITLAARERNGETFFKTSPQAYFIDNIKHAATGKRTPPDWWRKLRKDEDALQRRHAADNAEAELTHYLKTEAREAFAQVSDRIFAELVRSGHEMEQARERANYIATNNLRTQFYREHPECRPEESQPQTSNTEDADE